MINYKNTDEVAKRGSILNIKKERQNSQLHIIDTILCIEHHNLDRIWICFRL